MMHEIFQKGFFAEIFWITASVFFHVLCKTDNLGILLHKGFTTAQLLSF